MQCSFVRSGDKKSKYLSTYSRLNPVSLYSRWQLLLACLLLGAAWAAEEEDDGDVPDAGVDGEEEDDEPLALNEEVNTRLTTAIDRILCFEITFAICLFYISVFRLIQEVLTVEKSDNRAFFFFPFVINSYYYYTRLKTEFAWRFPSRRAYFLSSGGQFSKI